MQGSRSLFQTGIKIGQGPTPTGIRKSRPFLNVWASPSSASPPPPAPLNQRRKMSSATTIYDFKPLDKKGAEYPLSTLSGKVVLFVNVASKCGFTPQYTGLEALYKNIHDKYPDDFVILGFPCNQFGNQEPGSDEDIQQFCQLNYGVSFPILGKTDVNGDQASPLWEYLKKEQPGLLGMKRVKWNFEKFLVSREGKVVARWASTTKPESLEGAIEAELKKGKTTEGQKAEL